MLKVVESSGGEDCSAPPTKRLRLTPSPTPALFIAAAVTAGDAVTATATATAEDDAHSYRHKPHSPSPKLSAQLNSPLLQPRGRSPLPSIPESKHAQRIGIGTASGSLPPTAAVGGVSANGFGSGGLSPASIYTNAYHQPQPQHQHHHQQHQHHQHHQQQQQPVRAISPSPYHYPIATAAGGAVGSGGGGFRSIASAMDSDSTNSTDFKLTRRDSSLMDCSTTSKTAGTGSGAGAAVPMALSRTSSTLYRKLTPNDRRKSDAAAARGELTASKTETVASAISVSTASGGSASGFGIVSPSAKPFRGFVWRPLSAQTEWSDDSSSCTICAVCSKRLIIGADAGGHTITIGAASGTGKGGESTVLYTCSSPDCLNLLRETVISGLPDPNAVSITRTTTIN